jgi:ribose transport system ATP-binding protein
VINMNKENYIVIKGITKSFYNVKALDNVSFSVKKGEIHAIVGENGAGKSTLMKILSGVYTKDAGEIFIDGKKVDILSPDQAQKLGIATIFQEFNLIQDMSVAENIFLGREPRKGLFVDYNLMAEGTRKIFQRIGFNVNPYELVKNLGIAEQQIVEIAKALSLDSKIFIMDEPTAVLTDKEIEKLFALMKSLKNSGVTILYISHRLKEIIEICDRVTVLRDGKYIATKDVKDVDEKEIVKLMVGRELNELFPRHELSSKMELLRVEKLTSESVKDINFKLLKGEILGIAGLVGAGRTELAETIFGIRKKFDGQIYVKGELTDIKSPIDALKKGICLATEDRKSTGLILEMDAKSNITIPNLEKYVKLKFFIDRKNEISDVTNIARDLAIDVGSLVKEVKYLSGGNQQKVVLAKWILKNSEIYIMDEPTRGIDIGAKREIYYLIKKLADMGKGIIVISSEMQELLGLCDRILVMWQGKITGEFYRGEATEEEIMLYATGLAERSVLGE